MEPTPTLADVLAAVRDLSDRLGAIEDQIAAYAPLIEQAQARLDRGSNVLRRAKRTPPPGKWAPLPGVTR